ncbi:MAG: substrate-binding periplasmic protein [Cellvibrionaceae bacterium]
MIKYAFLYIICAFIHISHLNAQTITLTTEHYPPYNIDLTLDGGVGVGGAATEIVLEMMRRSGYSYNLELMSWKRAYESTLKTKNTGAFSTTYTEARKNLFKWVGPLVDNDHVLLAKESSTIKIDSIDDVKEYSVGAYRGSSAASYLQSVGLKPELVRSDHLNPLKLQRGRIDFWMAGHLYGPHLAKQYDVTGLKPVYTVRKTKMYLAFNIETADDIINKLNAILRDMEQEGFLAEVYKRY